MKKLFMACALLGCCAAASAQVVVVESVDRIPLPQGLSVERAEISPDGMFVVASSTADDALRLISVADGSASTIADHGEIYDLKFSSDSRTAVYRQSTMGERNRRYTSVKAVDLSTGTTDEVLAPTRRLHGTSVTPEGRVLTLSDGKLTTRRLRNAPATASQARPMASICYGELVVTVDGRSSAINPQGRDGMSYLWASVSPDGTRVLYYLAGSGCYVCDLDGSNPRRLGDFRAPHWLDDSTVVGMVDHDNGYVFTASTIIAADLEGNSQTLTDGSVIAMYPSCDALGRKVAFTTPTGELYVINLKSNRK